MVNPRPNPNIQPKPRPRAFAKPAQFQKGLTKILDVIAPAALIVKPNYLQLGALFCRTLFVYTYPRYVNTNWLNRVINYDITLDMGMFIYPMGSAEMLTHLRQRAGQLESSYSIEQEKGMVRNPELETAIQDIEGLRDVLQKGESRLFQFGLYFTFYATTLEELENISKQLESALGGMLVYTKRALLQMEPGFNSTLPLGLDELAVLRNLDTGSLSASFPFVSSSLTSNEGILYGINRNNNSLIIFDRFTLENANTVVFAKAGSGKSYAIKLEALRSLMFGTDIIVIDPENEYKALCEAVGGTYFNLSINSKQQINPFDLPKLRKEYVGEDALRGAVASLHGLIRLMVGGLNPEEDAVLDKALYETYALKDITPDPASQQKPAPILSDLTNVLQNMTGAEILVKKLSKYTEGTFAGLFNRPTNFELKEGFIVFSIRDLEDELRPVGMYLVMNYIWNQIRTEIRKRIMIVDEAWWMMQHEESAQFMFGLAKRSRKYYLGLTIITQDVEDFLDSKYGRTVIANSSLQILMKQSSSSIDKVAEAFNLTDGEKFLLLECDVGEGLFFAGTNHVAIKVIASPLEDQLITTDPKKLLENQQAQASAAAQTQGQAQAAGQIPGQPAPPPTNT